MFKVIEQATASKVRISASHYQEAFENLNLSQRGEDGTITGPAIEVEKTGQVLAFRDVAKRLGFGIISRKQENGSVRIWKVPADKTESAEA